MKHCNASTHLENDTKFHTDILVETFGLATSGGTSQRKCKEGRVTALLLSPQNKFYDFFFLVKLKLASHASFFSINIMHHLLTVACIHSKTVLYSRGLVQLEGQYLAQPSLILFPNLRPGDSNQQLTATPNKQEVLDTETEPELKNMAEIFVDSY